MQRSRSSWFSILLTISTWACAAAPRPDPGVVRDDPRGTAPTPVPTSSAGPWSFSPATGTRAYRVSRNASIEGVTDSAVRREAVSNLTHEILTLEQAGEEMSFRAVVDTFAVVTQGPIEPAQIVPLPIQLTGSLGMGGVRVESPPTDSCDAIRATVATDIHNLLAPMPSQLTRGAVWRDVITTSGCQAGIPTTAVTRRIFTVAGEVNHSGRPLLLVQRVDSVDARGEGAYGQHRMKVEGSGAGTALYYLDTASGEVSQLTTNQRIRISVTTSGRLHSFTQTMNQDFVRVR